MQAIYHFRRRVSVLAEEIARGAGLSREECEAAGAIGLLRVSVERLNEVRLARLMEDVKNESAGSPQPSGDRISPLIEVARAFVEGLEYGSYQDWPPQAMIEELRDIARAGFFDEAAVDALAGLRAPAQWQPRFSVYPAVLLKAMALVRDEDAGLEQIERVLAADQVLASSLLSAANSAAYGRRAQVTTVSRALAAMGVEAARKVLATAGVRTLFASKALEGLWLHSLAVAECAEGLARRSKRWDPAEAYVAGLLHDIGRLAMESMPGECVVSYRRLAAECPVLADLVLTGADHGETGAALLRQWGLPDVLTEAVQYHHRPELKSGSMAVLLYLAEFETESEEDVLSAGRLRIALQMAGIGSVGELALAG